VINIVFDFYQLGEGQDIVVENEQQYIYSRLRIRKAIHQGNDLRIGVKNRRMANWYESLKDYPDTVVRIKSLSPKSILTEKLELPGSLSLSFPLDDDAIMQLKLIEKAISFPPKSPLVTQKDVENWILSVCIDKCWADSSASLSHLSKLISFFLSGNADLASQGSLEALVRRRKSDWINSNVGDAYRWLLEEPVSNSFLVFSLQILKAYEDSMRQIILTELAGVKRVEPVAGYLDHIAPCECSDKIADKAELSNVIEIKWKNALREKLRYGLSEIEETDKVKTLKQRFDAILDKSVSQVSGRIAGEIDALAVFVRENAQCFDKRLFNLVSARFYRFPEKIKQLEDLIAPRLPSFPAQDWDWTKTSEWLEKEYFPYANWSLRYVKEDKFLEERAKAYGDWLYHQYPRMKNDLAPLNYGTWHLIKNYLDDGYQVLWLIIDNLCWFYIEDAAAAFREKGFHPTSTGPIAQLSMLPSETKVSKTALVAGKLPCQVNPDMCQKYPELFEQQCKESGIDSYRSIPDHELRTGRLGGHKITCCIINKLDVSSHQGFFDFEEDVRNLFINIAGYLKNFIPPEIASKKFRIVVSTDHGSCRIPNYIKGRTVPKVAIVEGQHRRFVHIDSEEGLDDSWYFLDKHRFGLTRSMAIAKGYGFVGNKRPKALIHGGMTPEETFIPLLEFCLEPKEIKGIRCIHDGAPIHPGPRKQRVDLLIRNPNQSKVTGVHIFVPSYTVEIDLDEIPGNDEKRAAIEIALRKEETLLSRENVATLKAYYTFDYQGERKSGEFQIEIRIRRIIDVSETEERLLEF
jgi:hypothetical protein